MRTIIVIGGGFAGTSLVKHLERRLPQGWQLILVSEENYMTYTPLLPEVVGASLMPGHTVAPIRKILRRARYFRSQVEDIDLERNIISFQDGKPEDIQFDQLIFAFGKVPNARFIEGLKDHALPL